MGIRHGNSVAYLSRSNGRAEVPGRQLFKKLRKIHITNPRRNWFEEMWPALKAHHDTPTPGGLSPHQILLGRDPLGRGLPLSGDGMATDAKEFFARQQATVRDIPMCSFGSGTSHSGFTRLNPVKLGRGAVEPLNRG